MSWETNTSILARLETFSAETAWTRLADHFERPLARDARRSGLSEAAVQDVVQETLVVIAGAYRHRTFDRTPGRLASWLFGMARREVASARRTAAIGPVGALDSALERDTPDQDEALERIWEEEWRRAVLERCVERVREEVEPATWACFSLQAFDGLGASDVAARLGLPITKVYNARHRVSRRLRELAREPEDA